MKIALVLLVAALSAGCKTIPVRIEACTDTHGVRACGGYSTADGAYVRLSKNGSK
jgi:hypothetical protein